MPTRVPERLVRDSRRDAWIVVLPSSDFIDLAVLGRDGRLQRRDPPQRPGLLERLLPGAMLVWAVTVWALLFYFLMHL